MVWGEIRRAVSRMIRGIFTQHSPQVLSGIAVRNYVEHCFEVGKSEVGLADYEVRAFHGWYRHYSEYTLDI